MKASYKLQLEQHQRRLGLTHKELNKLDRKHNDINLINHLQSLEPKAPEKAEPSGFWGDFLVVNGRQAGSSQRHMHVYLAYNDLPVTDSHQINSNHSYTFSVLEEHRLPLPSSTLQLKVTMQNNTQAVDLGAYDGFTITGFTTNPLNEENTLSMLVNPNNLNDGNCAMTFLVTYEPGWSGTITFSRTAGGGTQYIYIRTEAGNIVSNQEYTGANSFSINLANAQSYVEIGFDWEGYWEIDTRGFSIYIDNTTDYYDDGIYWYRYSIPHATTASLTYNFTTFNND